VLVLYSTFLTRSGVLGDASVHSFVDPGNVVYIFLILFTGTFLVLGLGAIAFRWNSLSDSTQGEEGILSRELALFTAAVVLLASAIIIIVGTSAPIFGQSVDTFFYDEMHIPLAIIIGLLNGLSLLIKWKNTRGEDLLKKSIPSLAVSLFITVLIIVFGGVDKLLIMLLTFSTVFALVVNSEIVYRIIRGNKRMLGAYVAHIGIAIFILGVIGSSVYSKHIDIDLAKNETQTAFGYEMTFTGWKPIDNNTKYSFSIDVKKGSSEYNVEPVMYISDFNNSMMRIPAILTLPMQDLYFSPNGYDEGKQNNSAGKTVSMKKGESSEFNGVTITFTNFNLGEGTMKAMQEGKDFQMGADLLIEKNGNKETIELLRKETDKQVEFTDFISEKFDLKLKLISLTAGNIEIAVAGINENTEQITETKEVLYISASVKPMISLVWIGIAVMVFGFFIAVARRLPESISKSS
jgi:cytochrome c-type biogenesis protein CcmF